MCISDNKYILNTYSYVPIYNYILIFKILLFISYIEDKTEIYVRSEIQFLYILPPLQLALQQLIIFMVSVQIKLKI